MKEECEAERVDKFIISILGFMLQDTLCSLKASIYQPVGQNHTSLNAPSIHPSILLISSGCSSCTRVAEG